MNLFCQIKEKKILKIRNSLYFLSKKTWFFVVIISCFFLFFLGCSTEKSLKQTYKFDPLLSNSLYYQTEKFANEDIFEKGSNKLNFLYFYSVGQENLVVFIQAFLSVYSENFLRSVNEKFPNSLNKYNFFERRKEGKFEKLGGKIQIQFYQTKLREFQTNKLFDMVQNLSNLPSKLIEEKETWILKSRSPESLWKESERKIIEGNTYTWIYHEFGELMYKRYPFTAYSVNDGEVVYSRLLGVEENIFYKQTQESPEKIFKLYSNREYFVYYLPNENFLDYQIFSKEIKNSKNELSLLKNQFPILVYKKNLKTNGN